LLYKRALDTIKTGAWIVWMREFLRAWGKFMSKKISVWFLILATAMIVLPPAGNAAPAENDNGISVSESFAGSLLFQPRRMRKRGNRSWNRYKWNRGRVISARNRRYRLARKYYWLNGVRRVRIVKVYY
jgi:hypothetical protein